MRFLYLPLLFALALLLQSAGIPMIFPQWVTQGVDLPLVIVVHIALTRGKSSGMVSGLILGYLQDALSGGVLGFNGMAMVVAGFTGGLLREKFFVRSTAHRSISIAGAVLAFLLVKISTLVLFAQPYPPLLSAEFLWALTGNTAAALFIHILLDRFETSFGIRPEEEIRLGD
ncbi:MAG: rod shape-determining protein MreD [bacterium]|nr:rod shape-determining protein MreD [bacterium]MDT8396381.1 rod shape-determining protein MreD [bacterium]